jgi:acyl-CoA thioesterase II
MTPDPATAARLVQDLVAYMQLEPLGGDRFLAQSEDIGTPAVFGGQVLGQSLMAANLTVGADRPVHSMHAYFLLPGEHAPIEYSVDRVRDGRSFTTRHVVARQQERIIFEMSASFQTVDEGVEHQIDMPEVAGPEGLVSELDQRIALGDRLPEPWRSKPWSSRTASSTAGSSPTTCSRRCRGPRPTARSGCARSRRCPTTRWCTARCWPMPPTTACCAPRCCRTA